MEREGATAVVVTVADIVGGVVVDAAVVVLVDPEDVVDVIDAADC